MISGILELLASIVEAIFKNKDDKKDDNNENINNKEHE